MPPVFKLREVRALLFAATEVERKGVEKTPVGSMREDDVEHDRRYAAPSSLRAWTNFKCKPAAFTTTARSTLHEKTWAPHYRDIVRSSETHVEVPAPGQSRAIWAVNQCTIAPRRRRQRTDSFRRPLVTVAIAAIAAAAATDGWMDGYTVRLTLLAQHVDCIVQHALHQQPTT